jgi:hypothetical protein
MDDAPKPAAAGANNAESVFSLPEKDAGKHATETAQQIYASIAQDAPRHAATLNKTDQELFHSLQAFYPADSSGSGSASTGTAGADPSGTDAANLDQVEQQRLSQLDSLCNAHAAAADPINAGVDGAMNPAVLTGLLNSTQLFLEQLNALVAPAQDLEAKGRPQLYQTLKAWLHDAQATCALINYALHTPPGSGTQQPGTQQTGNPTTTTTTGAPQPAPAPGPAPIDITGIWDMQLQDGRRVEFSCDGSQFSYVLSDNTFAFWGVYTVYPQQSAPPLIEVNRKGGYPTNYYGPLGKVPITNAATETWGATSYAPGNIGFGNCSMIRRPPMATPLITAHISQVQVQFTLQDQQDANNMNNFIQQQQSIKSSQDAMWAYINSGAGRPK